METSVNSFPSELKPVTAFPSNLKYLGLDGSNFSSEIPRELLKIEMVSDRAGELLYDWMACISILRAICSMYCAYSSI